MPYLPEDENQEQSQAGASGGSQVVPTTGGGGGQTAGTAAPQAGAAPGATNKGTGFVNLDKYVKANANQNFGGQVVQGVDNSANDARSSLSNVQNNFQTAANAGTVAKDNNVLNQIKSGQAANVVKNQNSLASYNNMANAAYTGPRELSTQDGFLDLAKKYGTAQSNLNNTQTSSGRYALLSDMYGRPQYSHGEKRLDQAILQADPNSRQQFESLRQKYAGIENDIDTASQSASADAIRRAQEMDALRKQTQGLTKSQWDSLNSQLNTRMAGQNAQRNQAYQNMLATEIAKAQQGSIFTPDAIAKAVTSASKKGKDLTNISQVASKEDIAKYNALAKLMGVEGGALTKENADPLYTLGNWRKYLPEKIESKGTLRSGDGKNQTPIGKADDLDVVGNKVDKIVTGGQVKKAKRALGIG
jgi:hypothetical protein